MLSAAIPIHSTGINWGQALATWLPIVFTLIAGLVATIRFWQRWNKQRQDKFEQIAANLVNGLAKTMADELKSIHQHLDQQDRETKKRFDRVDRNTGTDST